MARARGLSDAERARLRAGFYAVRAQRYQRRRAHHGAFDVARLHRQWARELAQLNSQRQPDESTLRRRAGIAQMRELLEARYDH